MPVVEYEFAQKGAFAEAVAAACRSVLDEVLRHRPRASLALPGGTTPGAYLPELARAGLPWERIDATLTDERWVEAHQAMSNEAAVRRWLVQGGLRRPPVIGLKTGHPTPTAALPALRRRLAHVAVPFDLVVLGMGEDGHVASLFPRRPSLGSRARLLVAEPRPPAGPPRVSLSPRALRCARRVLLTIAGSIKLDVVRAARRQSMCDCPVALLLGESGPPVDVFVLHEDG